MGDKYADETVEEFSSRLFGIIDGGFTTLSIAFGVKTGLFDALVKHHETPMTSQELAHVAGMKERYVREWLGAMTSAHIVIVDPTTEKYYLPSHRIRSFDADQGGDELAMFSKGIPLLSEVFNNMLESGKADGPRGLSFTVSKSFSEFDEDYGVPWYKKYLCQEFIPSLPEIQAKLERGIRVLDVGCGRGFAARLLAQRFPKSTVTGLDIRAENVKCAVEAASSLQLQNVEFVCANASEMSADWTASFDYVFIFNVLHDAPRPDLILEEVKRVMKNDDGVLSVFEFDVHSKHAKNIDSPTSAIYYTISLFHCLPVSFNFPGSHGLGLMWGKEQVTEFLQGQGFVVKSVTKAPGIQEAHFLCEVAPAQ